MDFFIWMVTVVFYAALHYLRAFLKLKGFTPGSSHFDLEKAIDQNNPRCLLTLPKEIYLCYRQLYEQSRSARYNTVVYSSDLQQKLIMLESKRAKNG